MPPKNQPSKKTVTKAKEKKLEETTFGLKNKNKSKKVQQFVNSVRTQIHGQGKRSTALDPNEARKLKKEAEKERQKQMLALFRPAETAAEKEKKKLLAAQQAAEAAEGSDDDSGSDDGSGASDSDDDSDIEVVTIDDIIEQERARITEGTAVTEEKFFAWKAAREARRQAEEAAERKKQGGSAAPAKKALTGRELFSMNAALFVDDDEAVDVYERESIHSDDEQAQEEANLEELDFDPSLLESEAALEGQMLHESLPPTYDADTWPDPTRPPKSVLTDLLGKSKRGNAKFDRQQDGLSFTVKVTLPEALGSKAFETPKAYNSAKSAENAAALMALHYIYCTEGVPSN